MFPCSTMNAAPTPDVGNALRFDRVAISCVFGDPRDPRSWSGAPANLANALERLGVAVEGIRPRMSRLAKWGVAARDMAAGLGRPLNSEQVLRGLRSRRRLAAQVADAARSLGARHVLHTGTFDLPAPDGAGGVEHYLYCDHSWALAKTHHVHASRYSERAMAAFEQAERESLDGLAHVFTFGAYVRDNLISHYGLPADRVTAVGSGMGAIEPYDGREDLRQAGSSLRRQASVPGQGRRAAARGVRAGAASPARPDADRRRRRAQPRFRAATGPASPSMRTFPGTPCSSSSATQRCWFNRC